MMTDKNVKSNYIRPTDDIEAPLIEEEKQPQRFCEMCYENHPEADFQTVGPCGHAYCAEVLTDYFNFQILQSGKSGEGVKCLQHQCGQPIEDEFIKNLVNAETFKKYEQFKKDFEIQFMKDKKYCPNPKCQPPFPMAADEKAT